MNNGQAISVLSSRGWLSRVPEDFRAAILSRVTYHAFDRGDWVFEQDGPSEGMWGIASGMAVISIRTESHPEASAHVIGPGQWTGAAALVLGSERVHGLRCLVPSQFVFLSARAFDVIAKENNEAWRWMAALPAMNMQLAFMTVEDLLIQDPRRRCAAILLRLAGCRGPFRGEQPDEILLTQEQLALSMNMSRTVLGEVLRALEKDGCIERRYKHIVVMPDALRSVSIADREGVAQ
ncbi:MAG: Crp/Fnr family transcriptional regulator [Rhodobacterales bacterium]|nr:Crp/Fnr family transcriptional regulator [Rhodobacterales bacterium]